MSKKPAAVEGTTKVVGIFGDPVDHSLSPRMHNAAFAELELDYVYVPLRANRRNLKEAVRSMRALGIVGANVTVPFKRDALKLAQRLTPTAKAIGAVNTLYFDDKRLVGDNTDSQGFVDALAAHGLRARKKRVLVIGAGGSARAVLHGLLEAGVADVVVANRTLSRAAQLARDLSRRDSRVRAARLDLLDDFDFLETRQLVVNCTPVGLKGEPFLDYDVDSTPKDCLHFDLAYAEKPTPFLAMAASRKRPTVDGRYMLLFQGAAAFKRFTGRRAPLAVMAKALGIKLPG
jgi:shikimate dehydrogenase